MNRVSRKHVGIFIILLLVSGYVSVSAVERVNDATRADLAKHVSNKSCTGDDMCPGELRCYQGSYDLNPGKRRFDVDRVGVNLSEPRCVTPTYVERHCGLFEYWNGRSAGGVHYMGPCYSYSERHSFGPINYVTRLLNEDDPYDRVFNTDRNGEERIRSHDLTLAVEDPGPEQFDE